MSERVIPIISQPLGNLPIPSSELGHAWKPGQQVLDQRKRPLRDLRISVTDRCNFRCSYCMPKEIFNNDYVYLPHSALLSFEEITRTAQSFIELGVEKIRLTGGEPLLRKNLEVLIGQLAVLKTLVETLYIIPIRITVGTYSKPFLSVSFALETL